jgi:hypothetical protein
MRKQHKSEDGKYHIGDKTFTNLVGSRAQVYHETAYKTSGGLKKADLVQNKNGRIVSKKKQATAKKDKRLEAHGFFAEKGKFGMVKRTARKAARTARKAHTVGGKTRKR